MPIYAYRCTACGAEKDVLQKISDPALTKCPACSAEAFHRVLTAPAFQLKGTGWYVTDFRDGQQKKPDAVADANGKESPRAAPKTESAGASESAVKAAGSSDQSASKPAQPGAAGSA